MALTLSLMERHIFKPSPYFQGVYESFKGTHEVAMEGDHVVPKKGFTHPLPALVLAEELFYNKKYMPFRVLIINRVLDTAPASDPASFSSPDKQALLGAEAAVSSPPLQRTSTGYSDFLQGQTTAADYRALQRELTAFSDAYVVVEGYLDDARQQVQELCQTLARNVLHGSGLQVKAKDQRNADVIFEAVEGLVLGHVSDSLHRAVAVERQADVQTLAARIAQHAATLTPIGLGLPPALEGCQFRPATRQLQFLRECSTPMAKVDCMHQCIAAITLEVENLPLAQHHCVLTTDDMIPLIALVILRTGREMVPVDVAFATTFALSLQTSSELGFSVVSFQAALQYLLADSFPRLNTPATTASQLMASASETRGCTQSIEDPARPGWRKVRTACSDRPSSPALGTPAAGAGTRRSPHVQRRDVPPPPKDFAGDNSASATQEDMGSFLTKLSLGF